MRIARKLAAVGTVTSLAALGLVASATPSEAGPPPLQTLHPDRGAPGTAYLIGKFYQFANGGGAQITWRGGDSCSGTYADFDYKEFALDQEDFDNRTSSLNDYSSCDTQLWQYANFEGEHSGGSDGWFNAGAGEPYNLATWDNRASSARWS